MRGYLRICAHAAMLSINRCAVLTVLESFVQIVEECLFGVRHCETLLFLFVIACVVRGTNESARKHRSKLGGECQSALTP